MNSTSCSYNSASRGQTCSVDEGELDELFIQLGESDEGLSEVVLEGELVESLPNSTSRDENEDNWMDKDSASYLVNSASQVNWKLTLTWSRGKMVILP